MNMPGFTAESCLVPTKGVIRWKTVYGKFSSEGTGGVMPQLGFQSDPDLGAYLRCRANGGAISYAGSLAGFLPSQSVASCSDRCECGRS
jgi:hypothetical protein